LKKKEEWIQDKEKFMDLFSGIMLDPLKAEQSMNGKLREIHNDMKLNDNEKSKFHSDFKLFYLNSIDGYQECLRGGEPDYKMMILVTMQYYERLDQFIEQYHGEKKADEYKRKSLESRAGFLARLITYGNMQ
jgi:hypothetical protein